MLSFRTATEEDIPLLRTLAERIWRGSYAEMISAAQIEYMLGWMYSEAAIRAEIAAAFVWQIALLEENAIGYCALEFANKECATLHKLYLLPELQGRGLGQRMLAHLTTLVRDRGAREIRLRVNKANARALRAYARAGFQITESLIADIGGGYVMDDYVLVCHLPAEVAK